MNGEPRLASFCTQYCIIPVGPGPANTAIKLARIHWRSEGPGAPVQRFSALDKRAILPYHRNIRARCQVTFMDVDRLGAQSLQCSAVQPGQQHGSRRLHRGVAATAAASPPGVGRGAPGCAGVSSTEDLLPSVPVQNARGSKPWPSSKLALLHTAAAQQQQRLVGRRVQD